MTNQDLSLRGTFFMTKQSLYAPEIAAPHGTRLAMTNQDLSLRGTFFVTKQSSICETFVIRKKQDCFDLKEHQVSQ
jgi:hypothetical protein